MDSGTTAEGSFSRAMSVQTNGPAPGTWVSGIAMNRRAFAAFTAFGVALPLVAGVSRADETEKGEGPRGKPAPAPPSSALSVDEIVARVEAVYDKVTTFKAGFRQRSRYDDRGSAGSVSFEKPSKMSFRYTKSGNRVVSDGRRIKVYEKENKQMYEQPLEVSLFPAVLSFLSAESKFGQRFRFSQRDSKLLNAKDSHVLIGDPLQPSSASAQLVFYVNARSYEMHRVLSIDAQGNRTRFDFIDSKLNPKLPPGEFSFILPPGTQIIRL